MKKLLIAAAAVTLAIATTPALVAQVQAAPAKSPFCKIGFEGWNMGWQQYYHCFGTSPRVVKTVHHVRGPAKSPFCKIGFEGWNMGWQQYYHCFGRS